MDLVHEPNPSPHLEGGRRLHIRWLSNLKGNPQQRLQLSTHRGIPAQAIFDASLTGFDIVDAFGEHIFRLLQLSPLLAQDTTE
jgi:hypothetical protein